MDRKSAIYIASTDCSDLEIGLRALGKYMKNLRGTSKAM